MNSDNYAALRLLGSCTVPHSLKTSLLESSQRPCKVGHLFPYQRGLGSSERPSCPESQSKGQGMLTWKSSSGSLLSTCQAASHTPTACSLLWRGSNLLSRSVSLDACLGSISRVLPEPHAGSLPHFLTFKERFGTCHYKALLALIDSWYFNVRNTTLGLPLSCEYDISATRWLGRKPAQVL